MNKIDHLPTQYLIKNLTKNLLIKKTGTKTLLND